jgi:hypothetical protein
VKNKEVVQLSVSNEYSKMVEAFYNKNKAIIRKKLGGRNE